MNEIQNSLFEAMKVFAESAAANSESTITIQGAITAVTDAGKGEYSIEYLGNTISAYANSNVTYSVGDVVYVLVPDGDFSNNKVILSLVNPVAETFANDADNTQIYYEISDNLADNTVNFGDKKGIIKMSSYETTKVNDQKATTMPYGNFAKVINGYLEKYRTFSLSFIAQTSMVIDQQNSGNYGVTIKIPLIENAASGNGKTNQIWKTITLDTGNMLGNPYRLTEWAPQSVYFSIDEQYVYDSTRIPTISWFCYGFNQDASKTAIKDIWIKDISFNAVDVFADEDTSGYRLTLKASQGNFFSVDYDTTKTITPTLRVNGKTTSIKKAEIYWFIEDAEVRTENRYYSPYGGYGWRCLNERTNIAMNSDGTESYDYITSVTTWNVTRDEVKGSARYKCVIIHNDVQTSAIIALSNLDQTMIIDLKPTLGSNVFIKDTGYVDLTATVFIDKITSDERNKTAVVYSWMRYDKNGQYIEDDENFFSLVSYNTLVTKELHGSTVPCFETRIQYPVNKLEDINNVFCSAKYVHYVNGTLVEELIGTSSVMVTTSTDFTYNLIVNGGNQMYKYDSDGDSPAGSAYDGPSTSKVASIPALTYTIRKANGEELSNEEYCYVKYTWIVPKNSLFTITKQSGGMATYSEDDSNYYFSGYDTYKHTASLTYGIATRFNIAKANKNIVLRVEFQGTELETAIPITFMKEGMKGSNGTAYAAELVSGGLSASTSDPYGTLMANGVAKKLKFVYNISNGTLYRHDYTTNTLDLWSNTKRRIYPRVYYNGELLSVNDYDVSYSMFDDKVTNPCFYIYNIDSTKGVQLELSKAPNLSETYCNILQAKITPKNNGGQSSIANSNQVIYCYYPIELTVTNSTISIIPSVDGGYAEVMYASDGTNPSWDETSAFVCNDDAMLDKNLSKYFDITWSAQHHLKPATGSGNTFMPKPDNKYDDGNSKNLVTATLKFNQGTYTWLNTEIARMHAENVNSQNMLNTYTANLQYLRKFAAAYKGAQWNQQLQNIQQLLDRQTDAVYRLNSLLETSLVNIDNYMNTQQAYNKSNIKTVCANMISEISILKRDVEKAIIQIQRLNGDSGYTYDNLISLANDVISWTTSMKDNYTQLLGLDSTITLQLLVEDINRQVNEYQDAYSALKALKGTSYLSVYKTIQNDIAAMCNTIPNSAMLMYVDLASKCRSFADNFNRCTSIKDIKQCISDMYDKVLRGTFYLSGNTLSVSAATNSDFATLTSRCNNAIAANNATISNYQQILSANNISIVHHRPIVLYFNRYEMSNINAWDGNKIETGDGSYLLAPQVGAGIKENDNSFTGIVMGLKNFSTGAGATSDNQVGMFGYSKGRQSLRLDARTGTSIFGIAGTTEGGQVIIDPDNGGLLYSSNYWTDYNKNTGTPNNYLASNKSGKGMLLDLKQGHIHLGSAHDGKIYSGEHITLDSIKDGFYLSHDGLSIGKGFVIAADGVATANANGGNLGGWRIKTDVNGEGGFVSKDGTGILLDSKSSTIVLGSSAGKIYSGKHTTLGDTSNEGFYLSNQGLSIIGKDAEGNKNKFYISTSSDPVIYTGKHTSLTDKDPGYYIGADGLSIGSAIRMNATDGGSVLVGNLKSGNKYWTINGDTSKASITYGTRGNADSVSLRTDELTIGSKFYVSASDGSMRLGNGAVAGTGKHWTIDGGTDSYIGYGTSAFNSSNLGDINNYSIGGGNSQIYIGTNGIRLGTKFAVDSDGNLVTKHLIAKTGGNIGGWTIGSNSLSASNITISANGSIETANYSKGSSGWKISSNGYADFNWIKADKSGSIGGWTISSNSLSSNGITIGSNGTISSSKWSINGNGYASFSNVMITGGSIMIGNKASITNTGNATFNNIIATGTIKASGGYIGSTSNTIGTGGLSFTAGGISLGAGSSASKRSGGGIYYNNGTVKINGDIYANNGYFSGEINATSGSFKGSVTATSLKINGNTQLSNGIKLYGEDTNYYLKFGEGGSKHPSVSGLNVGSGGINASGQGIQGEKIFAKSKFICDGHEGVTAFFPAIVSNLSVSSTGKISWKTRRMDINGGLVTGFSDPEDNSETISY